MVIVAVSPLQVQPVFSTYQAPSLTMYSGFWVNVKVVLRPSIDPVAGSFVNPLPPPPEIASVTSLPKTLPDTPEPVKSIEEALLTRVTPSSFIFSGLPTSCKLEKGILDS